MGLIAFLKEKFAKKDKKVDKYQEGLAKSRKNFSSKLNSLSERYKTVNQDYFDELEQILIERLLLEDIKNYDADNLTDYKSKLQEEIQAEHRDAVQYVTVETKGPAHDRTFRVQVRYNDIVLGEGEGKSKKKAEEMAAKSALSKRSVI